MTIRLRRVIAAPREAVFRAWTSPEALRRWWVPFEGMSLPAAEVDLRPGGRYRLTMHDARGAELRLTGVYREVTPPARLVYTWRWEGTARDDDGESVVTVEFVAAGASTTEVRLTHEGLPDAGARGRHERGWGGVLDRLAGSVTP